MPFIASFLIPVTDSQVSPLLFVIFGTVTDAVAVLLVKDLIDAPPD